ncbi:helix-turn-helix domain-containing protein [Paenibacillus silviterrae]|uniref:helix-turn-helix domain-containing protein n=1 Tax=Paenibacillus silviterrae TaxID=3242194 RepID=UPI002542ABDA|nr:helix-turn-helix domain-containing protein [Paenibacillus chinjuensis]
MVSKAGLHSVVLQYVDTHQYTVDPHTSLDVHNKQAHTFALVMKGTIHLRQSTAARQIVKASYGDMVYLPADSPCTFRNPEKASASVLMIRFTMDAPEKVRYPGPLSKGRGEEPKLSRVRMLRARGWAQELLSDTGEKPSRYYLLQSYLYAIAAEFIEAAAKPRTEDELMGYVVQVKSSMLEQCQEDMDMEELARMSGASPTRFYQAFRRYTGLSPLQFVTTARLNESLRLLSSQASTVMEAAYAVGYSDELYFSRLFKKHMGISPTDYVAATRLQAACLTPVFTGDFSVLGITPVIAFPRGWWEGDQREGFLQKLEYTAPEVIFTSPVPDEVYQRLARIAPVVMIKWKGYPWRDRLRDISRRVRLETVGERWLTLFDRKVENARLLTRQQLKEEPFLVVSVYPSLYRVYGMQRKKMQDLFYGELGVQPPDSVREASFLDVTGLDEIARLQCSRVIFLVPQTLPDESCLQLEEEWHLLHRKQTGTSCMFLKHEDPLLYNALFYEGLVDAYVDVLLSYRL